MAFAAPQFSSLMQVPVADHDTDMLSDAPEEGHDFDIDVDAMSDAEDRDVDFVLDGGNAPAVETGSETVDQEMREATTESKTVDAPMGEPDHVPEEIMDAVLANSGQVEALQATFEPFGNQNSTDTNTGLLSPSGDGTRFPSLTVQDATLTSFEADPKASHTLPTTTNAEAVGLEASAILSGDSQAEEPEAEHPQTQTTSNDPAASSPDQARISAAEESKIGSHTDHPSQEQSGLLQTEAAPDPQYHEGDEQAEDQNDEGDEFRKLGSGDCAALVSYDGSLLSLFPPVDGLPEAYLLEDVSLAEKALRELFIACRHALGASIYDDSQLQIEIPGLQLIVEEDSIECSIITLLQIVDIHHQLNRNDGIDHLVPLPVTLRTRPRMSARLRELNEAIGASKGYSSLFPEDDEYDPAEDEADADEPSENYDGDGLDSGYENPSDLDHDNQEADGTVNESATERDTNSERKSGQETDPNTTPGDDTADDGYSEDESHHGAHDSIEQKTVAVEHDLGEESEADESPAEFNVLDPFPEDNEEGQPQNDEYAVGDGKSAEEGSGAYLGAHEATLNEEEEYAQLDDWLAPEEENFGFANDADADGANGEPLGDDDAYGNGELAYGGEWDDDVEAPTSPAKPNSDSPLGKRAREKSADDAGPESDQEAKRIKST